MIPGRSYAPEDFLRIAWRRKWLIVIPAVLIATAGVLWTRYLPDRYRSDTLILVVPQQVPESYVRSTVTTNINDRLQAIGQQILSRTRLERIIQDFNLYVEQRKTEIFEDIVERMRKDIEVQTVKGDAFRVSFTADSPRTAMRVAERLASLFIEENLRDRQVLADDTDQFLEAQLEDSRRRLIENEKQLQEYRKQHDGELPTQLESNLQGLHSTEMQLQALNESVNRDHDNRLSIQRLIADADAMELPASAAPGQRSAAGSDDGSGGSAEQQLQAARVGLRNLEVRLKPEHPDVIRAKRVIMELEKKAEDEALARPLSPVTGPTPTEMMRRNRLVEAKAALDKLDRQLADKAIEEKRLRDVADGYQRRIEAEPNRNSELIDLTRDYDTIQTTYKSLLSKKEDSQIAANLERRQIGEQFKVLDPARLPEKPSSPDRPRMYLMSLVIALAIGLGVAALAGYLDRTMRSEEDVTAAVNLPVLATIPLVVVPPTKRRRTMIAALSITGGAAAVAAAAAVAWRLLR